MLIRLVFTPNWIHFIEMRWKNWCEIYNANDANTICIRCLALNSFKSSSSSAEWNDTHPNQKRVFAFEYIYWINVWFWTFFLPSLQPLNGILLCESWPGKSKMPVWLRIQCTQQSLDRSDRSIWFWIRMLRQFSEKMPVAESNFPSIHFYLA